MMNKIMRRLLGSNVVLDEDKLNKFYKKITVMTLLTFPLLFVEIYNVVNWNNQTFSILILLFILLFWLWYMFIASLDFEYTVDNKKTTNKDKIKSSLLFSLLLTIFGLVGFETFVLGLDKVTIKDFFILIGSFIVVTVACFYIIVYKKAYYEQKRLLPFVFFTLINCSLFQGITNLLSDELFLTIHDFTDDILPYMAFMIFTLFIYYRYESKKGDRST
ncbi:hypothetical protein [Mammaliicoccus lentus]|uniref:hypothetical protein n=1 Tax=Mammaliicoccus lentus TaxID=42858 RepID=UPI002DB703D2|nr:hypothetical protein [Mammaliicoccus lentus]MEB8090917.1 hypothetical protein [Mammaliicoccus lentus]